MLEQELKKYAEIKAELQQKNSNGGFVVILGDEVLGVWQTRVDALKAGFEKYGDVQFLVKNIFEQNNLANFSRDLKLA